MKKFAVLGVAIALVVSGVLAQSPERAKKQDAPPRNQEWLKQLVGEWDVEYKTYMSPDQPPMEAEGTDSVRAMGNHWVVAETKFTMMGMPFSGMLSLGYDAMKSQFHATWIDSMGGYLWVYTGALNEAGNTLTLETEGPSMMDPTTTVQYKEVITITGKDTRTFSSSFEMEDGSWMTIVEGSFTRKKDNAEARHTHSAPGATQAMNVQYLEIVTPDLDVTCAVLEKSHHVTFGEPIAALGGARTATLMNGGRIAVRAPLRETETPVVRPYLLVDDIDAAIDAAAAAGAEVAIPPMELPGQGKFAIYILGGIEHGLWQN